ncbi:MAG: T9SS type A sorting domain-containing protein [Saprospiraceae bacterium]
MKAFLSILLILSQLSIARGQLHIKFRECATCDTVQNDPNKIYIYGPDIEYNPLKVADDYGVRNEGDKWHNGIDYNSEEGGDTEKDRGDLILAIEEGEIGGRLVAGYKRLFVNGAHNFGYGHLFWRTQSNTQSGGCYLKELMFPNIGRWAIVQVIDGDTTAIGPDPGKVFFGSDTLNVATTIAAGDPIGPTGGSGDSKEYPPHLHLYSNPNGSTSTNDEVPFNPLQFVQYPDTILEVQILKQNDVDEGVTLVYPGRFSTTIQVRPILLGEPVGKKRYSKIMDVDRVEILLRGRSSFEFELIEGPNWVSDLCLGGRIGGPVRYPRNADGPGDSDSPWYNTENQWDRTGIHPYAYRGDGKADPWDDFYFSDFATRIHQSHSSGKLQTAEIPLNARYPDGEYDIFAKVTTVRDSVYSSDTLSFTLDNFKPYVSRVTISQGNNAPFYDAFWYGSSKEDLNGVGKVRFYHPGNVPYSNQPFPLKIDIYASEAMESLTMDSIVGIPNWAFYNPIKTVNNARDHWTIKTILPITLSTGEDGHYTLRIVGNDFAGNSLLNMEKYAGLPEKNVKKELPLRQKEGQGLSVWKPEPTYFGMDSLHEFYYLPCPSGLVNHDGHSENRDQNCIRPEDIAEEVGQPSGQSEGWAIVHVSPALTEWSILWTDEEGNTISTDTIISGLSPGVYCYEVSDTNCCTIWACVEIEECSSIHVDAEVSSTCSTMDLGAISLTITDGKPPYTFRWNDGSLEEGRTGLSGGIYQVTIEDDRGCVAARQYVVDGNAQVCVEVVKHEPICGDFNQWGAFTVNMYTPGAYQYIWEKDGNLYSFDKDLIGIGYGEYCLSIRDSVQTVYNSCFTIHNPHPQIEALVTPEIPSNGFNGAIDLTLSNGQLPYWTRWTGPGITGENEYHEDLSGLPNGTYCVTVVDGAGCQVEDCMTVLQYDLCQIADDYQIRKPCPGQNTGKIKAICIPLNENEVFTYQWSDGQNDLGAGVSIDNLSPGTYHLTITSSLFACIEITSFSLEEAIPLETDLTVVNACPNNPNGSASFSIMQGEGPILVTWPDGVKANPRSGLAAGDYIVTITDKHGCSQVQQVIIDHIVEYDVQFTAGCVQGDIAITVAADEAAIISWGMNPVPISVPYSGVVEDGTYLLNIVMPSCTLSESFTYENFTMDGSYEISYPCDDNSGGQISTVVLSNAPGNFTYQWNTGDTGSDLSPLALGTYCVTATNLSAPHCVWTICVPVDQYFEVTIDVAASVIEPPCHPASNGSILPAVSSNSTGLLFQWDSGETTKNIYNKPAGTYCLTVYDVTGTCMTTECFTLVNKKQFDVYLNEIVHSYGCGFGAPSGSIDLTSYNYKPGTLITYQWSSGETTEDLFNKPAGIYSVTVSNGEGCELVKQFEIRCCWLNDAEMNAPYFNIDGFNISPLTGPNTSDGALGVQVSTDPPNQNPLLTFIWRDEQGNIVGNTPVIQNLPDGKYCVEVSNGCGNTITQCRYIKYCAGYEISANAVIVNPCFYYVEGENPIIHDGSIEINPTNGYGYIASKWYSWVNDPNWCSDPNYNYPEQINSYEYNIQANITVQSPCNKSLILVDHAGCRDTFVFPYENGYGDWSNPMTCKAGQYCNNTPVGPQISGDYIIEDVQVVLNESGDPVNCHGVKYCEFDDFHEFGQPVYGILNWGAYTSDQPDENGRCTAELACRISSNDYYLGEYIYPYQCCELGDVNYGFHVNSDTDETNNVVIDENTPVDSLCSAILFCDWDPEGPIYYFNPIPTEFDTCIYTNGSTAPQCWINFACPWSYPGNEYYGIMEVFMQSIVINDTLQCRGYPNCIPTVNKVPEALIRVQDNSFGDIMVYPSVASKGSPTYIKNSSSLPLSYRIYTTSGREVFSSAIEDGQIHSLILDLNAGVYFVKFLSVKGVYEFRKFIILNN